jgi:hypothetical protein
MCGACVAPPALDNLNTPDTQRLRAGLISGAPTALVPARLENAHSVEMLDKKLGDADNDIVEIPGRLI